VTTLRVIGAEEVRRRLTYDACIPLVREAMIALSNGETRQLPRGIVDLAEGRALGTMTGALGLRDVFGAKVISVFPENFALGKPSHQGIVVLFDPETGAPALVCDAGEVTAIRTAAASAVATDALARGDASRMAVLGYGEQARTHIDAIAHVRRLSEVLVWGRSYERAAAFASAAAYDFPVRAVRSAEDAVREADIVCTVTAAADPILLGRWLPEGVHVNLVGSSRAGPREVDTELVARSRYFADHAEGVRIQGAELIAAIAEGSVGEGHLLGEIGEVLSGKIPGRTRPNDITAYKSLGHIVQDLAAARFLMEGERPPEERVR
jgi:ornithine cyclodeaminase